MAPMIEPVLSPGFWFFFQERSCYISSLISKDQSHFFLQALTVISTGFADSDADICSFGYLSSSYTLARVVVLEMIKQTRSGSFSTLKLLTDE